MKYLSLFCLFLIQGALAQNTFIRTTDSNYGSSSRIMPADNGGWTIFSADSLKLTRYNSCGFPEWSKKYYMPEVIFGLYDFIRLNNGEFAFMNRIRRNNVEIVSLTKIDQNGNILWSKSYGDINYEHFPYTLMEDNNGNLFIYSNVSVVPNNGVSYNELIKTDASGNLLWTRFYNFGGIWGGAIITSDNGFLLRTGDVFIKTDAAGNTLWSNYLVSDTYYYLAPVEVADGYIFSAYTNNGNYITYFKMDLSGNQLWGGGKTLSISGNPRRLYTRPNGSIVSIFNKSGEATIIEFDKDLNILKENSINNSSTLSLRDICQLSDGSNTVSGITSAGFTFFAHLDVNFKSGCDISLPSTTFVLHPSSLNSNIATASNYSFATYTESYITDTFHIDVTTWCVPAKTLDLGNDTSFCAGNSYTLSNLTNDTFDIYQWSTGETTATITPIKSGTYYLSAKDFCGELTFEDSITVTIQESPNITLGKDITICENESALLKVSGCDSCIYLWNNGNNSDTVTINEEGIYIVTASNTYGCENSDTIEVMQSKCECDIYLPNAFSPNNDGINETFQSYSYCDFFDYQLTIFNRWGEKIFSTKNPTDSWNGNYQNKTSSSDIYIYSLDYTSIIKGAKSNPEKKTGHVLLIR